MSEKVNTREIILQTASRLFQLQGYHATGLNQIIKESGSPKGSLYYHFPQGKEELAIEAVNYTSEMIQLNIRKILSKINDPVDAIQTMIQDLASQFSSFESIQGIPIGLIAVETSLVNENIRKACEDAFDDWQNLVGEKLIENGFSIARAKQLAGVTIAMIEGALILSLTKKSNKPLLDISEQIPLLIQA
ncbi:MAG TPA: TetR/AcrR family transcriptional regulator [Bacillota bacterium]|nr:TetR/AcrR family transcriptional regulator [Bacillota bacterium]